jgi:hypothetical protein
MPLQIAERKRVGRLLFPEQRFGLAQQDVVEQPIVE